MLQEVAETQRLDLFAVDRGLIRKIERVQALDERESRQRRAHGDVLRGLGRDFFRWDLIEELGVRELLRGGVLQHRFNPLAAGEQAQTLEMSLQALELGGGHRAPPDSHSVS